MIAESTGMSIGLVAVLAGTLVTCTVFIVRQLGSLRGRIDALTSRLASIEKDNYTVSQAAEEALRMAIANPGLRVPDPRKPGEIIEVQRGKGWISADAAQKV